MELLSAMTKTVKYRARIRGVTLRTERIDADGRKSRVRPKPVYELLVGTPVWPPKYGDTEAARVCEACPNLRVLNTSREPYCLKVSGCVNCRALLSAIATLECPEGRFDHLKGT